MFASQCEFGRYHVSPEVGIVEIIDSRGKAVEPGVEGEVVCTGLQNVLQPLIRYRLGDCARWAVNQSCPCGRELPILDGIEGRIEDVCLMTDGRQIMRFDTVFKGVANIREAQIVQDKIDLFIVNVVPSPGFGDPDMEKIRDHMRLHVGNARVQIECVADIPRTSVRQIQSGGMSSSFGSKSKPWSRSGRDESRLVTTDEVDRISAEFARRERSVPAGFYALDRPANLFANQQKNRGLLSLLAREGLTPLGAEEGSRRRLWRGATAPRFRELGCVALEPRRYRPSRIQNCARQPQADTRAERRRRPAGRRCVDVTLARLDLRHRLSRHRLHVNKRPRDEESSRRRNAPSVDARGCRAVVRFCLR